MLGGVEREGGRLTLPRGTALQGEMSKVGTLTSTRIWSTKKKSGAHITTMGAWVRRGIGRLKSVFTVRLLG